MGRSEFDYLPPRPAWNAGRKVGTKRPLKPRQIWAIRFHLDREHRLRDRALLIKRLTVSASIVAD